MRDEPTWSALPVRSFARPQPAERAAAIARLEAWAIARGARCDALELRVDGGGNSMSHAARDLAAGEAIVTIPRSLMLVGETRDTLATWLPVEATRADSPWKPFLDVLPVHLPDLPMFHGGAEVDLLAGTAARRLAADEHREVVETYAGLSAELRGRVTLADYAWGRAIVRSRGFNAPDTIEARIAFIPIVDLMDHAPGETTWHYDVARAEYVVTALRRFATGAPVHFDYGAYGNTHLFVEYGFALPDNPLDEIAVEVGGELVVVAPATREALLERATIAELADAARARLEGLTRTVAAPPEVTGAWPETCALVRRGERAALERFVAWLATIS